MEPLSKNFQTVDEYHSFFPGRTRQRLDEMRSTIREAAPEAEEIISYNMPAFKWNGVLVWYGAAKHHIGLYPSASPIQVFKEDLLKFKTSKGAIQIPLEEEIPKVLVKKIVQFRKEQVLAKLELKKKKK